jgi:hypothetical protein
MGCQSHQQDGRFVYTIFQDQPATALGEHGEIRSIFGCKAGEAKNNGVADPKQA